MKTVLAAALVDSNVTFTSACPIHSAKWSTAAAAVIESIKARQNIEGLKLRFDISCNTVQLYGCDNYPAVTEFTLIDQEPIAYECINRQTRKRRG